MEQEIISKDILERFGPKLWSKDKFLMTLMKLRIGFYVTNLSRHFGRYLDLVTFALKSYINGNEEVASNSFN